MGMLGETVGGQLPPLIRFRDDDVEVNFVSALMLENANVQPAAVVTAYFEGPVLAQEVRLAVTIAAGALATNLSCLCLIPLAGGRISWTSRTRMRHTIWVPDWSGR
jgi:hypothetical protein